VGAFAGGNLSHGMISQPFSPFNLNKLTPTYAGGFGFQAGGLFNFYATSKIQISLEPMFAMSNFNLVYDQEPIQGDNPLGHTEKQTYIYVPLSGTYEFAIGKFRPYLRLGVQLGFLVANTTSSAGIFDGPDEDNMENRNQLNYWALGGAGFKYKLNKSYFFVDLRYNMGLNQYLVSPEKRFIQPNHNWVYMYQDSDFRLNSFMISAGYARSFFNPKRVK
ncbi:outer membrane beta-barrel protein, partial [Bacteroidota bacterium]